MQVSYESLRHRCSLDCRLLPPRLDFHFEKVKRENRGKSDADGGDCNKRDRMPSTRFYTAQAHPTFSR
jgi:hypothetical protein